MIFDNWKRNPRRASFAQTGGVAKYLRLDYLQYPSTVTGGLADGKAYYHYPASGDGAVLSRLQSIGNSDASTEYVEYDYFGAANIFKVTHPAVNNGLTLDYDVNADHAYNGLNRPSDSRTIPRNVLN